jgi:hypothetical protein
MISMSVNPDCRERVCMLHLTLVSR